MRYYTKQLFGSVLLLFMLILGGCNSSTPVEPTTPYQKQNEAYVNTVSKSGEYNKLLFLNETYPIYYKVLETGAKDAERPLQNSTVKIDLQGKLIDPEKQSIETGFQFQPPGVITVDIFPPFVNQSPLVKGMRIALQSMKVGDKWQVVIPWQLGYGSYQINQIPAYSTLVFTVKLLEIVKE